MAKKKKSKFYVVWKGHQPGIYTSWSDCQQQIAGYSGAEYKSFSTRVEAERAYDGEYGEFIERSAGKPNLNTDDLRAVGVVLPSISVDAACSGNPGPLEYQGVDTETGATLFHKGPYPDGTVNIGEFLALVHGLAMLRDQGHDWPIYSDSKIAIGWVQKKACRTKLAKTARNARLFALCARAETWLKENDYPNEIIKWKTSEWGEIRADFGRK